MTMITVKYTGSETPETDNELWQYALGQVLLFEGLPDLGETVDIHFSFQKVEGTAREVHANVTPDGIEARIPDEFLVNGDTVRDYKLHTFVYPTEGRSGHTAARIDIPVKSRPRPAGGPDKRRRGS